MGSVIRTANKLPIGLSMELMCSSDSADELFRSWWKSVSFMESQDEVAAMEYVDGLITAMGL